MTLQDAIQQGVTIQFDSNEQLQQFVEDGGYNSTELQSMGENDTYLYFCPFGYITSAINYSPKSYHISQLTQPTAWWDSVHTMD